MPKKLTQAEFLAKAVAVHGVGRYDYSQVVYSGSATKVTVVCSQHGAFCQSPNHHLQSQGCPICWAASRGKARQRSSEQFIALAQKAHGQKYDYSLVEYKGSKDKVSIICPEHGEFRQVPATHTRGTGCSRCGFLVTGAALRHDVEEFLTHAREVHGAKYDYSLIEYVDTHKEITIICPVHGAFNKKPIKHTSGRQGCPTCGALRGTKARTHSTAKFITRARDVHGDKYDYSATTYTRSGEKVSINCLQHGSFTQAASMHLSGNGCPQCANITRRMQWIEQVKDKPASLYFLRFWSQEEEFFKVGVTKGSVRSRYGSVAKRGGYEYEVLAVHTSSNAGAIFDWEQSILETFGHLHYHPKQPFVGASECFSSADEILQIFPL